MQARIYSEWMVDEITDKLRHIIYPEVDNELAPSPTEIANDDQLQSTNATDDNDLDEKTKYNARRQQVREAQKRHRQRKVTRIKELELSASSLRADIARANDDAARLRHENEAMRQLLENASRPSHGSYSPAQDTFPTNSTSAHKIPATESSPHIQDVQRFPPLSGLQTELMTVSIAYDENVAGPRFFADPSANIVDIFESGFSHEARITKSQENIVINFILALESGCWGHFQHGDFHHHDDPRSRARGHMLMASAFYMQDAPDHVYGQRRRFYNPLQSKRNRPQALTWQAQSPTLQGLWGLATSLNTGDIEITPIQAWFELADQYPLDLLFQPGILQNLARELRGAMRCVIYGASIDRIAFESIVSRVLGPLPDISQKPSQETLSYPQHSADSI